ncbi:D(2) dopamine receptor A-like [Nematostella vectensis]|uniref:D(2) dopamine receptor A-like n=1 Tax=Nematostella vectensis TaxID=45351 RepID=UPI00139052E2|nr:D(2) dopamine receptor A-like [Nematostella vectensis]
MNGKSKIDLENWITKTQERSVAAIALESLLFIVIDLCAVIGNVFVCLAVYRNRSLRTVTHIYILALAITDLTAAVLSRPLSIGAAIMGSWPYGHVVCTVQGIIELAGNAFSLVLVSLTAASRYFKVVKPAFFVKFFSTKTAVVSVFASLFACVLMTAGSPRLAGAEFQFGPHFICMPRFRSPNMQAAISIPKITLFILIPTITIPLCYWKVYRKVKNHVVAVAPSLARPLNSTSRGFKYGAADANITKTVLVVLIVFVILWIPLFIIALLYSLGTYQPRWSHVMFDYLIFLTAACNPIVYGLFNREFRSEFRRISSCISGKILRIKHTSALRPT